MDCFGFLQNPRNDKRERVLYRILTITGSYRLLHRQSRLAMTGRVLSLRGVAEAIYKDS
ncbi:MULTISPECIES: hypothetical protein [unclassified Helicobacter]|uniref:hypothetical protein n=1 Tax=unclassified Helicobacter TaxID=2593540 RepID=UPI0015F187FB|nr:MULTISPECIES: hypothetical protein [unclassified Helicobacter]